MKPSSIQLFPFLHHSHHHRHFCISSDANPWSLPGRRKSTTPNWNKGAVRQRNAINFGGSRGQRNHQSAFRVSSLPFSSSLYKSHLPPFAHLGARRSCTFLYSLAPCFPTSWLPPEMRYKIGNALAGMLAQPPPCPRSWLHIASTQRRLRRPKGLAKSDFELHISEPVCLERFQFF